MNDRTDNTTVTSLRESSATKRVFIFRRASLIVLAFALSLLASCTDKVDKPVIDTKKIVVADVDGEKIYLDKLDIEVDRFEEVAKEKKIRDRAALRKSALNRMVNEQLLTNEASHRGIVVTDAELGTEIKALLENYDESRFGLKLADLQIGFDQWKESVRARLTIQKMVEKEFANKLVVEEKEIRDNYEENKDGYYHPERVNALHILVDSEALADEIVKQVRSGKENFADMVRRHSQGAEAINDGGETGPVAKGEYPYELEEPLFALKNGEISEVIQSVYGYHIFKMVKREKSRAMTFEESKDHIRARLLEQKREEEFAQWLSQLRKAASIAIFDQALATPVPSLH
jgi:parvulin-like peptidyl-prolyl isomerase